MHLQLPQVVEFTSEQDQKYSFEYEWIDMEEVRNAYEDIILSREDIKFQWKQSNNLILKTSSLTMLYAQFVENVEGDTNKARKILQRYFIINIIDVRAYEKQLEGDESERNFVVENDSVAFAKVTAELVNEIASFCHREIMEGFWDAIVRFAECLDWTRKRL